jgi:hypothetical protein
MRDGRRMRASHKSRDIAWNSGGAPARVGRCATHTSALKSVEYTGVPAAEATSRRVHHRLLEPKLVNQFHHCRLGFTTYTTHRQSYTTRSACRAAFLQQRCVFDVVDSLDSDLPNGFPQ